MKKKEQISERTMPQAQNVKGASGHYFRVYNHVVLGY